MKLSIQYLDCCLSDYFQGFGGHVYAVPMHSGMRTHEVRKGLQDAIRGEEVFIDGEAVDSKHYDELHASANELFAHSHPFKVFSAHAGDECYAYFGVVVSDDTDD